MPEDATFVCAPALAMLSKITGNPKYLNWMDSFFRDLYGALYSQEDNLFYRDQRFIYQECEPDENRNDNTRQPYIYKVTPNGKKVLWQAKCTKWENDTTRLTIATLQIYNFSIYYYSPSAR